MRLLLRCESKLMKSSDDKATSWKSDDSVKASRKSSVSRLCDCEIFPGRFRLPNAPFLGRFVVCGNSVVVVVVVVKGRRVVNM